MRPAARGRVARAWARPGDDQHYGVRPRLGGDEQRTAQGTGRGEELDLLVRAAWLALLAGRAREREQARYDSKSANHQRRVSETEMRS